MLTCGAKTRSSGICLKPALIGKMRCRLHGGLSLSGKDHPNFIHGRRSLEYVLKAKGVRQHIHMLERLGDQLGMFSK